MVNIFLIHGSYGHPNENWFPWLKTEMEKLGCKVIAPKFPTPEGQNLSNWMDILRKYETQIGQETIFVGHSLGVALILRFLEKAKNPINAAFLVSGFFKDEWNGEYDNLIGTFIKKPYDWQKIRQNARHIEIYQSDNDPYIPVSMGKEMAKHLGAELVLVKNAGHFNNEAGYTEFPLLLESIKSVDF